MLDQKDLEVLKTMMTDVVKQSEEKMLQKMDERITDVKLHLENVTDKNIRIVAEGHLDLNRKLDEALKIQNEKEILQIRLNDLEGEIATVKNILAQLEQTA